ncbi:hypothetical protein evm_013162 [Chilo suppressalis]|nr:hypothetical protein evm_013162 [Chilo suppressalis]
MVKEWFTYGEKTSCVPKCDKIHRYCPHNIGDIGESTDISDSRKCLVFVRVGARATPVAISQVRESRASRAARGGAWRPVRRAITRALISARLDTGAREPHHAAGTHTPTPPDHADPGRCPATADYTTATMRSKDRLPELQRVLGSGAAAGEEEVLLEPPQPDPDVEAMFQEFCRQAV